MKNLIQSAFLSAFLLVPAAGWASDAGAERACKCEKGACGKDCKGGKDCKCEKCDADCGCKKK